MTDTPPTDDTNQPEPFTTASLIAIKLTRRAEKFLYRIQSRTEFAASQSRQVMGTMITGISEIKAAIESAASSDTDDPLQDLVQSIKGGRRKAQMVSIHQIERYADRWAVIIPNDDKLQALLADQLAKNYNFTREDTPNIQQALKLNTVKVQQRYEQYFGKPLESIYAAQSDRGSTSLLEGIGGLDNAVLREIENDLEWRYVLRGEPIIEQGAEVERIFMVVNGRVRLQYRDASGAVQVLGEAVQGNLIGEVPMIMKEPSDITAVALRDTELVSLPGESFNKLVETYPAVMTGVIRQMVSRLRESRRDDNHSPLVTIAVLPAGGGCPLEKVGHEVTLALRTYGSTQQLTSTVIDEEFEAGGSALSLQDGDNARLVAWLSEMESRYRFVVYVADPDLNEWTLRCIRQADLILLAAIDGEDPALNPIEEELFSGEGAVGVKRELLMLHERRIAPQQTVRWLTGRQLDGHHHVTINDDGDFERVARYLTGRAIGLVLAGGGARGAAHIGVFRALEEAGIPVDAVGGTSIGALFGGMYAMGWSADQMYDFARSVSDNPRSIVDVTLPVVSLIAGNRINNLLRKQYGDTHIEDLWTPFFAVSANITTAQQVVFRQGALWRAIRASSSLPTVMPPVTDGRHLLIDGGVFNNLPADIMKEQVRGGPVIAVNIGGDEDAEEPYSYGESISGFRALSARGVRAPGIVDVIMRTMSLSSDERIQRIQQYTDLYIEPPVQGFAIYDFASMDAMYRAGYETASRLLEGWQHNPYE